PACHPRPRQSLGAGPPLRAAFHVLGQEPGAAARRVRCWCAVLLVLSFADLWLTLLHLRAGGGELNPWLDWCHRAGGEAAFSAAKVAATLFGVGVLAWQARRDLVRHAVSA